MKNWALDTVKFSCETHVSETSQSRTDSNSESSANSDCDETEEAGTETRSLNELEEVIGVYGVQNKLQTVACLGFIVWIPPNQIKL
jgi:hypothetical protein